MLLRALMLLVAVGLCSCGGGGGGSSGITTSTGSVSFSVLHDRPLPPSQTVHVHINDDKAAYLGTAYTNGQAAPTWLNVAISGSGRDYDVALSIRSTAIAPDTYSVVLTVGDADVDGNLLSTRDIAVQLRINPGITITSDPIAAELIQGAPTPTGTFAISTSADGLSYKVTTSASWLKGPSEAQSGSGAFSLVLDETGLSPGMYIGTVTATAVSDASDSSTLNVTLTVEPNRLVVTATGVALSSFPSKSAISRNVVVRSLNGRGDLPWSASSDQSWLSVTGSGTTADPLVLTADPARASQLGQKPDSLQVAHVTVQSSDPSATNHEFINVGLWIGSSDPAPVSLRSLPYQRIDGVESDPVAPYAYFVVNYAPAGKVLVYNIYTGALVNQFTNLPNQIGSPTVSDDGSTLFVRDSSEITAINLSSGATKTYLGSNGYDIRYVRVDGHPILVYANGVTVDLGSGAQLAQLPGLSIGTTPVITVAGYGQDLYLLTTFSKIHYSTATTSLLVMPQSASGTFSFDGNASSIAASPVQNQLIISNYDPGQFLLLDADTLATQHVMVLPDYSSPSTTAASWNGAFAGGGLDRAANPTIWAYDTDGNPLSTTTVGTGGEDGLDKPIKISGDGRRFIAATQATSPSIVIGDLSGN